MTIRFITLLALGLLLFSSCKNNVPHGKWYIKTAEDLNTKKKMERDDCTYFEFKEDGKLGSKTIIGTDEEGTWRQSGDTMIIQSKNGKPAYLKIDLFTSDSLVLTLVKDDNNSIRLSLNNAECTESPK